MAEKMSTIVMRVDLDCDRCYKKIRKVLCKLQDRVNIKTISYDEKSNTVTVSGPFDAEEVSDKLCSDAGKVITDIHVAKGSGKPGGAKAPKPGKEVGGGGGKPEKRHVKFDFDDEGIDQHAHHHAAKPRVVTTTAVSRLEAPRAQPPASMAARPMPMPMAAPTMMPQATAMPSIWPAAPEWGYSAPVYGGAPPAGGYYGESVYGHGGGYGPYGYGRNPYQPQYHDEEPSAGCSVM